MRRFFTNFPILQTLYSTGFTYPAPSNLTLNWNFGIYAFVCLLLQIVTGIFLAMHYTPDVSLAFFSVEHIMRDVNNGWIVRYFHANGASFFFIAVYMHMLRGLYYSSFVYPRHHLWSSGVVIFLLMIVTAFLGYVSPWGQMSFWAATVITNLASAVPLIGKFLVIQIWGGYSVDNATLVRFFSLHFTLPFVIFGLVIIHFILLHEVGSNNPLGVNFKNVDSILFTPYYVLKDFFGVLIFFFFLFAVVFFMPNVLGHPDNYIPANPLVTPKHIVPEWYFLLFYGILRSIPDKLLGVLSLLFAILVLFLLPISVQPLMVRTLQFRPFSKLFFWFFFSFCILLAWIGSQPIEFPFLQLGFMLTCFYFFYLLILMPSVIMLEEFLFFRRSENMVWFYYKSDLVVFLNWFFYFLDALLQLCILDFTLFIWPLLRAKLIFLTKTVKSYKFKVS